MRKNFGDKVELWTGSSGEDLIAGVVIIKYENTIEYFTPVVEEEFRDSQALSALIYDLMEKFFHARLQTVELGRNVEISRRSLSL